MLLTRSKQGVRRLIGHYIEDDALDAFALTGMINGEGRMSLTTSTTLRDFADWAKSDELDFVLIDIFRPDSSTFTTDIEIVRQHSKAPIFFVTGDEAQYHSKAALRAGASGVLEKEDLTADRLYEAITACVEQKQPRVRKKASEASNIHPLLDFDAGSVMPLDTGGSHGWIAGYLQDALMQLSRLEEYDPEQLKSGVEIIAVMDRILSTSAADRMVAPTKSPDAIPQRVRELQVDAISAAEDAGLTLAFHLTPGLLSHFPEGQAEAAIRFMLLAVFLGSSEGASLWFSGLRSADGTRLSITANAPFQFQMHDVSVRMIPDNPERFAPTLLMTAAVTLLGAKPSNFTAFERDDTFTLLIDIQDT